MIKKRLPPWNIKELPCSHGSQDQKHHSVEIRLDLIWSKLLQITEEQSRSGSDRAQAAVYLSGLEKFVSPEVELRLL